MDKNDSKNSEFIDFFPDIEYFLNAHLSSLLNGYVPPMQNEHQESNIDDIELLDDDFFDDIDKRVKF